MHDLSTLTLVAIVAALVAILISALVAVAKWMTRPLAEVDDATDGTVIWCSYEVAVDKDGHKYFISTLPDGVQTIAPANPVEIGPGLPPSTRAFLKKPDARESELGLPWKRVASELDEGTLIRVRVVR